MLFMYLKHIIYHIFRKFFLDNHCLLTFLRSFYLEDRDTYLLVFMHIKIITRSRFSFSLDIKGATEFCLILGITSYQVWSSSPKHKVQAMGWQKCTLLSKSFHTGKKTDPLLLCTWQLIYTQHQHVWHTLCNTY